MICSVDDCPREGIARTWCLMHWKRWKRTGDPAALVRTRGWTVDKSTGYRRRLIDGKLKYEHRYVMEVHLGRPLELTEQVHHIDGDRTNNSIDNLAVMMRGDHQRFHNLQDSARRRSTATPNRKGNNVAQTDHD